MTDRFIKLIPSAETEYLLHNKPNAFKLLYYIAKRARREDGHPDGLKPGQCYLGDWEACGLTRQNYRSSLAILVMRGHVKIEETCRTRQKSTTGSTTVGTLVELLTTSVYDINKCIDNHEVNHRPTTDQPQTRRNKKEKESIPNAIASELEKVFFDHIRFHYPTFQEPNHTKWIQPFDLMLRIDKRDPQTIRQIISWLDTDKFWLSNILCPAKLRKQFDALVAKMQLLNNLKPKKKETADAKL